MKTKTRRLRIVEDSDTTSNPREWDNLGTIVTFHRRYRLGDEQPSVSPEEWVEELLSLQMVNELSDWEDQYLEDHSPSPPASENHWTQFWDKFDKKKASKVWKYVRENYVILPVYMYDHGVIQISTRSFSCKWDSGQIGWIFSSNDAIKAEGITREQARESLESEIKVYDCYLRGQVWGYVVEDIVECDEGHYHVVDDDSCWGFIGEDLEGTGMSEVLIEEFGFTEEEVQEAWDNRGGSYDPEIDW